MHKCSDSLIKVACVCVRVCTHRKGFFLWVRILAVLCLNFKFVFVSLAIILLKFDIVQMKVDHISAKVLSHLGHLSVEGLSYGCGVVLMMTT